MFKINLVSMVKIDGLVILDKWVPPVNKDHLLKMDPLKRFEVTRPIVDPGNAQAALETPGVSLDQAGLTSLDTP